MPWPSRREPTRRPCGHLDAPVHTGFLALLQPLKKARALFGNRHVFKNRLDFWNLPRWTYVYDTTPLRKTLLRYFDLDKLRESSRKVIITAVDLIQGRVPQLQQPPDHRRSRAGLCQSAIVFPMDPHRQHPLLDGGLLANVPPLKAAIDVDDAVGEIYVVKCSASGAAAALAHRLRGAGHRDHPPGHPQQRHQALRVHQQPDPPGPSERRLPEITLNTIEFREPFEALSIINFNRGYVSA